MSAQTYETFLRVQAEKAQYGVVIIPARTALDMADFIEKKRANGTDINVGSMISREAAIDALSHMCSEDENGITVSRANVNSMLRALPSAQPVGKDINVSCKDTISRQAAIDFIDAGRLGNPNEPRWSDNEVVNFLKSRPSAQPEPEIYWGYASTHERPLADVEIVPRLRTIQRQVGGSYAIDRAIEIIEAVAERRTDGF